MLKDLSFEAEEASVKHTYNSKRVKIEVSNADKSEVLDNFTSEEIIEHFGLAKLLEDVTAKEILDEFEHDDFIEELDDEKIAEHMQAGFVASVFTADQLVPHMSKTEILDFLGEDAVKNHFNL